MPVILAKVRNLLSGTYHYPSPDGHSHNPALVRTSVFDAKTEIQNQGILFTLTMEQHLQGIWVDITAIAYDLVSQTSGNTSYVFSLAGASQVALQYKDNEYATTRLKLVVSNQAGHENSFEAILHEVGVVPGTTWGLPVSTGESPRLALEDHSHGTPPDPGGGSGNTREDISGQITGKTDTFSTTKPYIPGSLEVWVNGLYQGIPPKHFEELTPTTFKFLDFMLMPGMELVVQYFETQQA